MSFYPDPIDGLIAAINKENGLALAKADYQFGAPTPLTTPTAAVNTEITLTPTGVQAAYDGTVSFKYKRLSLADLPTLLGTITLGMYNPTTLLGVAEAMNLAYGLNLTSADIVSGAVSLTDGAGQVTLTAKSTSLMWIGAVTVNVVKGNYPLNQFVTTLKLPGLNYPAPTTSKPFAYAYSYWRDFSAQADALLGITVGTDKLATLATVLKAVTGDTWVTDKANRYSLLGAKVSFVGLTADNAAVNQTQYSRVVVIDLDDTNSLGFAGQLILHFSLSDDD